MEYVVNSECNIPVESGVRIPCEYPRSEEERNGTNGTYDQTSHGEGNNYTDTDG